MTEQSLSPAWYRVAQLKPRLRSHARVHRHEYRGELWYVLEDRISRRTHRFDSAACFVLSAMNGQRSMQEIWDAAVARLGEGAPTQDEVLQLLSQLHLAEVLQCEITPDVEELLRRGRRSAGRAKLAKLLSPLSIKFPLLDPDRLLERWLRWYRPLFGAGGAVLWCVVVGWAAVLAFQHWGVLTEDITDRVLAPHNLLIMGLVFPMLKACHEFGHACAVKAWGGEVHEMGVMLLVLMPVPYVDASAASAFAHKWRRVVVGAAGMIVELFIASLALFAWLYMQPGLPRAVLFNVILIAGVSTVLFNANPLLRFDGYYILADLLEMPNLRQRAQRHFSALFQGAVLGLPAGSDAPLRERVWLTLFQVLSFVYRISVTLGIALFVSTQYMVVGVLLGLYAFVSGMILPIVSAIGFLAFSPRLRNHRLRAAGTAAVLAAAAAILLAVVPFPSWTNAQGVVWLPEQLAVRGGVDGFVTRLAAQPGEYVKRGAALVEGDDPQVTMRERVLEAQKAELQARYQADRMERRVRAQMTLDQLEAVEAELARVRERRADLVVRAANDGLFVVPAAADLPGRYVKQGETVGYVIPKGELVVRVLVPQQTAELVRNRTRKVLVRLAEGMSDAIEARVVREVPRASDRLPSMALAQSGGGEIALDPQQHSSEPKALQTHFQFEIELPDAHAVGFGARAYVRFELVPEPVALQLWRVVRQLFLGRFAV